MRISGKGITVIIIFLVVIQVIIDLVLVTSLSKSVKTFGMSGLLSSGYLKSITILYCLSHNSIYNSLFNKKVEKIPNPAR